MSFQLLEIHLGPNTYQLIFQIPRKSYSQILFTTKPTVNPSKPRISQHVQKTAFGK